MRVSIENQGEAGRQLPGTSIGDITVIAATCSARNFGESSDNSNQVYVDGIFHERNRYTNYDRRQASRRKQSADAFPLISDQSISCCVCESLDRNKNKSYTGEGRFFTGVRIKPDMVPNPQRPENSDRGEPPTTGFDEAALYTIIRDAVKDALLDVIGTVLLLGIASSSSSEGYRPYFRQSLSDGCRRYRRDRCRHLPRSCNA